MFLGRSTFEQDAWKIRPLLNYGGGGKPGSYLWVPCLGGNEGGDITTRRTWMDDNLSRGVNINSSGDQASGIILLPSGSGISIEVYLILNTTGACALDFYFSAQVHTYLGAANTSGNVNPSGYSLSSTLNWLTDQSVTLSGIGSLDGGLLNCYIQAESTPTNEKKVFVVGWVVLLG